MLEGTNRKELPARNTLVQLLTMYTDDHESRAINEQRYRQTDGRTDGRMMPIVDHTV